MKKEKSPTNDKGYLFSISEELSHKNMDMSRDNFEIEKIWSDEEYREIGRRLENYGCQRIKERREYILFREVKKTKKVTEVSNFRQNLAIANHTSDRINTGTEQSGVISPLWRQKGVITPICKNAPDLPSLKGLQSDKITLQIGFDTESQTINGILYKISLQMSILINDSLIRYFFLISPKYQAVDKTGGQVPLKYYLGDVLNDLRDSFGVSISPVRKEKFVYKEYNDVKMLDYKALSDYMIPLTLVCHAGKADLTQFRRSMYDVDILKSLSEIQGGLISLKDIKMSANRDNDYNYYWLIDLSIRDTLALTPADNKSLKSLGDLIDIPKIDLPDKAIEYMSCYALADTEKFYEYAMNDSDIVVSFTSEMFLKNHEIPLTLSSGAAKNMHKNIKEYLNAKNEKEYNKLYRGLEMLDEGILPKKDECLKFLKATRFVPLRENPDSKLVSEYFAEAYTGGFNASFYLGWITEGTADFDLKQAYPTAMATIVDIDWTENVRDFPRNYVISLQDVINPLIPCVAVGDFDFPEDVYCPNIPVWTKGGLKIYPRHGRNVYMTGPDMFLALKLGARIKVFRGFTCKVLAKEDGTPSKCLSHAVTQLVQDRIKAEEYYKPIVGKTLKTMVNSCYGKTAQNVSPKTRYNAQKMGRESSEPSIVTSPYHASYTTALVRCMLIGAINELHNLGYKVYSVTTDGFITNASLKVIQGLSAYGFASIFQSGREALNSSPEVWVQKHYNDCFLNITTRGNVAVNDEGVLAHNSYITGEEKDSRADREAYIIAVLSREGRIKCPTKIWSCFSDIVEKRHSFAVSETIRELSMNFDYKRCPTDKKDVYVEYTTLDGSYSVNTTIAEFDTRPFENEEEFLKYRNVVKEEACIKVCDDIKRVEAKTVKPEKSRIGNDLNRKIILSIIMGYRKGIYIIPELDGLKQSKAVEVINGWGISEIKIDDWKNCSRANLQKNMLPYEMVKETLEKIGGKLKE